MKLVFLFGFIFMLQGISFKDRQQKFKRVASAYMEKENIVKSYFDNIKLPYNGFNLFLRILKKERELQVWVKANNTSTFQHLTTYDFCATSGVLGPKRKEGDGQIPEGIYHINHFNPESNFHLSLGLNYPNGSDKILGDRQHPGSAIYIHGNCVTIGCIPITDDKIKELYILAVEARNNGQIEIPVHIFPSKMDETNFKILVASAAPPVKSFWENLKPIFDQFEKDRTLKPIRIDTQGKYAQ